MMAMTIFINSLPFARSGSADAAELRRAASTIKPHASPADDGDAKMSLQECG
jgi:hypothetical protein